MGRAVAAGRRVLPAALAGLVLTLLSWQTLALTPTPGLDPSWTAGLQLAARDGLDFGRDVLFTYGPAGFVKTATYWTQTGGAVALLYRLLTVAVLLAMVVALGRRTLGLPLALLTAVVVGVLIQEPTPAIALGWAAWLLARSDPAPTRGETTAFALGAGALGGFELLGKVSTGSVVLAVAVLTALALPRDRLRATALVAGAATATGLLVWLVTGQSLTAIPAWLTGELQVVAGYSETMGLEDPARAWEYTGALALSVGGATALWRAMRGTAGPRLALIWLVLCFLTFKAGFVRHDGHSLIFFSSALAVLAVLPWRREDRLAAGLAVGGAMVAAFAAANLALDRAIDPVQRTDMAFEQLATVVQPAEVREKQADGRALVRAAHPLDPATLALLKRGDVHVAPWDTAIAWAYGLDWDPVPVFQSYQAYTHELDDRNAEHLRRPDGPDRVLVTSQAGIDGRFAPFDAPLTTRALLCHYAVERATPSAVVLRRAASRCGPPRLVSRVEAAWGQQVPVPRPSAPDRMVYVAIHGMDVGGLERLRSFAFRAHDRSVSVFPKGRDALAHRVAPGVVTGGLPLWVPKGVDLPAPATIGTSPELIGAARAGDPPKGLRLRYEFFEQPVAAA